MNATLSQLSQPTIAEIAARLACSPRTVNRMKRRGIDPLNPVAVAEHLAAIKSPSSRMLEAIIPQIPTIK